MTQEFTIDMGLEVAAAPGWLDEGQDSLLYTLVARLPPGQNVVEIGYCPGRSTVALALGCKASGRRLYCLDTWLGEAHYSGYLEALQRGGLLSLVTPLRGDPVSTLQLLANYLAKENVGLALIGTGHSFERIMALYAILASIMPKDAIVALHDVGPDWPGNTTAWATLRYILTDENLEGTLRWGRLS